MGNNIVFLFDIEGKKMEKICEYETRVFGFTPMIPFATK